ncbi:hypothetical protein MO973_13530 [Paenibacillus sp. TRM 82003]|nr:hypothetical protein [Paenibacillus sp. TRM 82003]
MRKVVVFPIAMLLGWLFGHESGAFAKDVLQPDDARDDERYATIESIR